MIVDGAVSSGTITAKDAVNLNKTFHAMEIRMKHLQRQIDSLQLLLRIERSQRLVCEKEILTKFNKTFAFFSGDAGLDRASSPSEQGNIELFKLDTAEAQRRALEVNEVVGNVQTATQTQVIAENKAQECTATCPQSLNDFLDMVPDSSKQEFPENPILTSLIDQQQIEDYSVVDPLNGRDAPAECDRRNIIINQLERDLKSSEQCKLLQIGGLDINSHLYSKNNFKSPGSITKKTKKSIGSPPMTTDKRTVQREPHRQRNSETQEEAPSLAIDEVDVLDKWGVKFSDKYETIWDVWNEYNNLGTKDFSIKQLEDSYANVWRKYLKKSVKKKYNRRLVVIRAIETSVRKGRLLEETIGILENHLKEMNKPVSYYYTKSNLPAGFI